MDAEKAIQMIDEYLAEPNSIHKVWAECLQLCRQALEKQISKKCITDDGVVEVLQRKLELTMNLLGDDADKNVLVTVADIKNSLDLIDRQKVEIECKDVAIEVLKKDIDYQKTEIERWRANYTLPKEGFFNVLCGALVYTKTLEEYNQFRRTINAEAIKEFAERLRRTISISDAQKVYFNNLVKEMVGEIINENQISS